MKLCDKCENQDNNGNCCIDIYKNLGHTKGPSITRNILLAFAAPVFIFIGSMILSEYLLSDYVHKNDLKSILTFFMALAITVVFVQLIRIFIKKT